MSEQRSLVLFKNWVNSQETIKRYLYQLNKFVQFYHIKDYDSLVGMDSEKLQIMVEDYVMDIKKRVNPNSVPSYYYPIQTFLEANNIELRWKKIKKLFPARIKVSGTQAYETEDIQLMLEVTPQLRNKAIIHFLASTGCRIGALTELKLKNFTELELGCYAVTIYEGSIEEYVSFLTPEASKAFNDYLNKRRADGEFLQPTSPAFRAKYIIGGQPSKPISVKASQNVVYRACLKSGLRDPDQKSNGRFEKMLDHAFRKRLITILKLTDGITPAVAERIAGHSVYHDNGVQIKHDRSYMRAQTEKLFESFKLAIPELTVSDIEKEKIEKLKLQIKNTQLEKDKLQMNLLEQNMSEMQKTIQAQQKQLEDYSMQIKTIFGAIGTDKRICIDPDTGKTTIEDMPETG